MGKSKKQKKPKESKESGKLKDSEDSKTENQKYSTTKSIPNNVVSKNSKPCSNIMKESDI